MSDAPMTRANPVTHSILQGALGLGLFAVVTAGLIALTHSLTEERIADQVRRAQASALLEIIPPAQHDNDLLGDTFSLPNPAKLGLKAPASGYRARVAGKVTGVILPVTAPDGYSGAIRLLVGITAQGEVIGVRSLEHQETPGLGDKIELKKSDWILAFNDKSLRDPAEENWQVRKDGGEFDQFTGATITPRAVVKAVSQSLAWFAEHQAEILEQPSTDTQQDSAASQPSPSTGVAPHE